MIKYKVGSVALGLNNTKDIDYVVISNKKQKISVVNNDGIYEDLWYFRLEDLYRNLQFKSRNIFTLLSNYEYDIEIIGSSFPIKYHILDYKEQLIKLLKEIVNNKSFNFDKRITQGNNCCCKIIYHITYNLFILENNSPIITDEQKEIIQKIHDRLMTIDYLDELEHRIYNLK